MGLIKTQVQQQGRLFLGLQGGWEGRPLGTFERVNPEADARGRELGAPDSLPEGKLVLGVRTPAEVPAGAIGENLHVPCTQSA